LTVVGLNVRKTNGDPLPAEVKESSLVTVWRHLNIEADSMGRVEGNELSGTVSRAANSTLKRRGAAPLRSPGQRSSCRGRRSPPTAAR
jgi:hypothetical protein